MQRMHHQPCAAEHYNTVTPHNYLFTICTKVHLKPPNFTNGIHFSRFIFSITKLNHDSSLLTWFASNFNRYMATFFFGNSFKFVKLLFTISKAFFLQYVERVRCCHSQGRLVTEVAGKGAFPRSSCKG